MVQELEIPSHHKWVMMNTTTDTDTKEELELEKDQQSVALAMIAAQKDKSGLYGSMKTKLFVASLMTY